jgi:hypothetical protein
VSDKKSVSSQTSVIIDTFLASIIASEKMCLFKKIIVWKMGEEIKCHLNAEGETNSQWYHCRRPSGEIPMSPWNCYGT